MMRKSALWIATAALVSGATFGSADRSLADDESTAGVVRISDKSSDSVQQVSHRSYSGSNHQHSTVSRSIIFRDGSSPCGCSACSGQGYHHDQGFSHARHFYMNPGPLSNMFTPDSSCTHSPGHGWSRPVPYPVERHMVEYQRFWPARWYGQPGGGVGANAHRYPTVYQPTDTTQMGYYYQAVPQWRPNSSMVPPSPWPPYWHRRESRHDECQNVTIGVIDGRKYSGPQDPQFAPETPEEADEASPVPPSPTDAINSVSNEESSEFEIISN